jgi:hypothetical protein
VGAVLVLVELHSLLDLVGLAVGLVAIVRRDLELQAKDMREVRLLELQMARGVVAVLEQ